MANGPLHRPKLPGIPGIETFKGHSFHTSRWDYDYTGGDTTGGMIGLADKRVGIIGTGATAVQIVPHLAAAAKELYVFQRTPSSIDVRADRLTDDEWSKNLQPGWHKHRMENFNTLVSGGWAEGGSGPGRLDRHHTQLGHRGTDEGSQRSCERLRRRPRPTSRLQENGEHTGPGGRDCQRSRDC